MDTLKFAFQGPEPVELCGGGWVLGVWGLGFRAFGSLGFRVSGRVVCRVVGLEKCVPVTGVKA